MRRALAPMLFVAAAAVAPIAVVPASIACAAGEAHAGVVIAYSDTEEKSHCVALSGASSTGIKVLEATGVPLVLKQDPAFGAFVCKIGNVGAELADCPSKAGFWAYWHFTDGKWSFATTGAADYRLKCADTDGWVWTQGSNGAPPSQAAGFSAVCPGKTCAASASPREASAEKSEASDATGVWLLGGAVAAALGGAAVIWRMRRKTP